MPNYPADPRSIIRFTPRTFVVRVEGVELPTISTDKDMMKYGAYFTCTPEGTGFVVAIFGEEKFFDLDSLRHDLYLIADMYVQEQAYAEPEYDYGYAEV